MPKRVEGRVSEIEYFDTDLLKVRFDLSEALDFEAGQFMSIAVEGFIRRSYSVGNPPHENGFVETYVDASPGGPGSRFFLNLKLGNSADLLLPLGKFVYKQVDLPVFFFATGTGIVPFLSMIRHELERINSDRDITLYYGVRTEKRVMVERELEEMARVNDNFNYHLFVSRPLKAESMEATEGRFTQAIPNIDFDGAEVYVCGGTKMIEEVEQMALEQGAQSDRIYYEKFY